MFSLGPVSTSVEVGMRLLIFLLVRENITFFKTDFVLK